MGPPGDDRRRFQRVRGAAFRGWRTTRSTTATRTSSASTRTAYIDPNDAAAAGLDCGRPVGHDGDLEVRRLPPSAVQCRRRALRGAAHARARTACSSACGVDVVLSGHEHNYQRARPLKFAPAGPGKSADLGGEGSARPRRVHDRPRRSTASRNTRPDGVLYIVTGARREASVRRRLHRQSGASGRTPTTASCRRTS